MTEQLPRPRGVRPQLLGEDQRLVFHRLMARHLDKVRGVQGDRAASVVQQLHWYLYEYGVQREDDPDGYTWILASYDDWHDEFPWVGIGTFRRLLLVLEQSGLVKTQQADGTSRAKWYTIDYQAVDAIAAKAGPRERREDRKIVKRMRSLRTQSSPNGPVVKRARSRSSEAVSARAVSRSICAPCAVQPDQNAHPDIISERRNTKRGKEEDPQHAAAAQARAPTAVAPPAVAAAAAVDRPDDAVAIAELVAATFEPADAADLVRRTGATPDAVKTAVERATRLKSAGRLRTDVRGYVVAALERRYPSLSRPRRAPAAVREDLARELREQARLRAAEALTLAAEWDLITRTVEQLPPDQFDAEAERAIESARPDQRDALRRYVSRHGLRASTTVKRLVYEQLTRDGRLHGGAAAGAHAPAAAVELAIAGVAEGGQSS